MGAEATAEDEEQVSTGFFARAAAFIGNLYDKVNKFFKDGKFEKTCRDKDTYFYPFLVIGTHIVIMFGRYLYCLYWIRPNIITWNPAYVLFAAGAPFVVWAMSTMCEKFDAHGMKRTLLWVCIINAIFTVCEIPWFVAFKLLVMKIMDIKVAGSMTQGMVINLARIVLILSVFIPFMIIFSPVKKSLTDENVKKNIGDFRLTNWVDMRKDKAVAYDIHIMKEADGLGKKLTMKQNDLYTHSLLVGPSGTGKTSTSITPMIIEILDRKCKNRAERQKRIDRMLIEKKAYITAPVAVPDEYDVIPYPQYKQEFEQLYNDFPDAGITMVSPNDGIGDSAVELCNKIGVPVQMVDPDKTYEDKCVRHMGLNPFFVPAGLSDIQRTVRIVTNARNFSQILMSVNEAGGSGGGDQYFKDLNTSVTTNIAGTVMAYRSLKGEQTTLGEVKECVNDFKVLYNMADEINRKLNLGLTITNPAEVEDKNSRGRGPKQDDAPTAADVEKLKKQREEREAAAESAPAPSEDSEPDDETVARLKKGIDSYKRPICDFVRYVNDELFLNGTKMYDQSRGLRNILNEMVSHPDVYDILNVDENYIDYDRNLSRCSITVVDTAVRLGEKASSALGLFFLLNFNDAVQRRYRDKKHPRDTQIHFLIVDEAAQYTHKFMSQSVNLWRQYKVSATYAFQTLLQMDANPSYRDIKGSLLQVGNIITYGRLGQEEMETFEKLAGEKKIKQYQQSISQSSLLSDNASSSIGERVTDTTEANASATDLRYKNFKEATWYRYIDGNVLPPLNVMLDFADMHFFDAKGYAGIDYSDGAYDQFRKEEKVEVAEEVAEPSESIYDDRADRQKAGMSRAEKFARESGGVPRKASNSVSRDDEIKEDEKKPAATEGEETSEVKAPKKDDFEDIDTDNLYGPMDSDMSVMAEDDGSGEDWGGDEGTVVAATAVTGEEDDDDSPWM